VSKIVKIKREDRDNDWALELLKGFAEKGCVIGGFGFGDREDGNETHVALPDSIELGQLLMARAILDNLINKMINSCQEDPDAA
jgi:hypothetical protein